MALTVPPGFQAVGIRDGRTQAINRGQDQSFVFAMLKAIPGTQGGAREKLAGESVPIYGNGRCEHFLYELILQFQNTVAALRSKDGVVDPGGETLKQMMKLAGVVGPLPPGPVPGGKSVPNSESGLPAQRHRILQTGLAWTRAKGGGRPYRPSAQELHDFFAASKTEAVPTMAEAEKSLKYLSTGCYIQGTAVRHWCGIFACAVAISAGLRSFRWTLHGGKIIGPQLVMGNKDLLPGDIAIISQFSHHFVLTGFPSAGKVATLEGNTTGQLIRESERPLSSIVAFYRTVPL
jgi:hypothetical protein